MTAPLTLQSGLQQILLRAWFIALLCPLFVFASDVNRIRELNRQIVADSSSKSLRRGAASDALFRERATLLSAFIVEDPAGARALLLNPETLRDLRTRNAADGKLLERPFAYTGPVETSVVDLLRERRSERSYLFERDGETLTAHGGPGVSLQCGDEARLTGYRLGSVMLVTAAAVERRVDAPLECRAGGIQRLAVILANFPGAAAPELTKARIGELVFGASGRSAATFYKEASYGQLDLTGDVFGWYTVDRAYRCSEFFQLRAAVLNAADADIDFSRYTRIVVIHPGSEDCENLGQGSIGCTDLATPGERFQASYASIPIDEPENLLLTLIHELGHNFGLEHARTMRFPGTTSGPDRGLATFEEYGDVFSIMGSGAGHFSASQKAKLGWLLPFGDYRTVDRAAVFDLLPLQSAVSGVRALRVKRNTGDDVLWIEYRQPAGAFDVASFGSPPAMFEGALIRAQSPTEDLYSDLLDFTPASIDEARLLFLPGYFEDPVLRPGHIWRDPFSDLTLEVLSMTPAQLRIAVRYDSPCTSVSGLTDGTTIGSEGRPTAMSVMAAADCAWSAAGNRSWLDVPSGMNRTGSANLTLEAQRNSSPLPRRASVTIERKTFGVTQVGPAGSPSVPAFGPQSGSFPSLEWISTDAIVADPNGVGDLKEFFILINDSLSEQNACMIRYDFTDRTLALSVPETPGYSGDTIGNGEFRFTSNSRCGAGYPAVVAVSETESPCGWLLHSSPR